MNTPLTFELKGIDHAHPYLASRGVTRELAEEFGIGYYSGRGSFRERIVIPIHNRRGELVAYAGRSIEAEAKERYKFPAGFHKSVELYNLHRVLAAAHRVKTIIIVQGFFGCLRVHDAGYPCTALMGSSLSDRQASLIGEHFTAAAILCDGDDAGRSCGEECLTKLDRTMWAKVFQLPPSKQPDNLTPAAIAQLFMGCKEALGGLTTELR